MKKLMSIFLAAVLLLAGCGESGRDAADLPTEGAEVTSIEALRAEQIVAAMTLREKICQMMFVTPEAITKTGHVTVAGEVTRAAIESYPVGGIIYFSANIKSREQVADMISNTQSYSEIPLFIGVDEEGGRVARLGSNPSMGVTTHPAMGRVMDREEAFTIGKTLGEELSALLFNVDFAPVADVIVSEKNTEIGDRSFGTEPHEVGELVSGVVMGLEGEGVSSVLKHFPGHGSTVTDSHTGRSVSERTIEQLRQCEFIPFRAGIAAGCDFVMVSHMTLTEATQENAPASLSAEVIEGYLKGELGFEGIVVTDSLSMGAITKEYTNADAAVRAVLAGADMLLMPKSIDDALGAIMQAVAEGVIAEARIDESVERIIRIKIEKGML